MAARSVLVTGASGFIGGHICAALAARGDKVRALYRRRVPPPSLAALAEAPKSRVALLKADLCDAACLAGLVAGIDAVIHVAALASDWGPYEDFKRENYDATAALLAAAEEAGVKTFVYFSSAVVSGFGPHVDSTEEGPYYPLKYPYQISKRLAERHVLDHNRSGFKTVALRPCNVYGPGDRMSTYQMFENALRGTFGYIGTGVALTCPIYVDDLCGGVLAALDKDEAAGEAIILSDGEKVSWKDYSEVLFRAVGSRRRPLSLPEPLVAAAARAMTFAATAFRSRERPLLTMYPIEQGSRDYHFSIAKAKRILGFEPTVFYREGLERTAEAFLAERAARKA